MRNKKEREVGLPASEFMERHAHELAESEEVISTQRLAGIFPGGKVPLNWLMTPSPTLEAWLQEKEQLPGRRLMEELRHYWLIRLLGLAKIENSPQAYRELLEGWLIRLGVEAPEGVFIPRRFRGAPRKESTEQIYRMWLEDKRADFGALAYRVYRADYTKADAKQRKKLRDRCRRAVERFEALRRDEKALN